MTATLISIAGYGAGPTSATPVWIAALGKAAAGATEAKVAGYSGKPTGATAVRIVSYGKAVAGATAMWISGTQTSGGGPAPSSTWSAADASANSMTLSNGGVTITPAAPVSYVSARTTISKTSGKLYVEFANSAAYPSSFAPMFGVASSGFSPSSFLGSSNYSAGLEPSGSAQVSSGFTNNYTSTLLEPSLGDVYAIAIDFSAGSIWLARNNVWSNSSNPATASLPFVTFTPATVGALFAGISLPGAGSGVWTLQPTAASQKYLPPPGFQAWDGGPVTPMPSSTWSAADASAGSMTLSNGGVTVTVGGGSAYRSIRNTTSHTSGKWYVEFLIVTVPSDSWAEIGLADSNAAAGNYLGATPHSIGMASTANNVSAGFTSNYTFSQGLVANDIWALAVDFAGSIWVAHNNVWVNSSNPATGTLPIASFVPATVGALFAGVSFYGNAGVTTLQPTAASQKYAPPTGFTPWG